MKNAERLGAPIWAWIVWGVVVVGSLIAEPYLPSRIAIHFGVTGAPNGYSSRWVGALILPAIMVLLLCLWQVLWRIDPKRRNYSMMAPTYRYLGGVVIVFMALVQTFILLQAVHLVSWNSTRLVGMLVGLVIALLANVLPRVKANWWIGIRTPWTLSDANVWRKTHQVGGQTGVVAGLAIVAVNLVAPLDWSGVATMAIIIVWAAGLFIASYWFSLHPADR